MSVERSVQHPSKRVVEHRWLVAEGFEVSIVVPPRAFVRDLQSVFPDAKHELDQVKVILTSQHTKHDLVDWGDETAVEKDEKLESFMVWGKRVAKLLQSKGYFADLIDPCSALPVYADSCSGYSEVDGFRILLKYPTQSCGGCKIVLHPEWQTFFYPASMFSNAPLEDIRAAVGITTIRQANFADLSAKVADIQQGAARTGFGHACTETIAFVLNLVQAW